MSSNLVFLSKKKDCLIDFRFVEDKAFLFFTLVVFELNVSYFA